MYNILSYLIKIAAPLEQPIIFQKFEQFSSCKYRKKEHLFNRKRHKRTPERGIHAKTNNINRYEGR